VELAKG